MGAAVDILYPTITSIPWSGTSLSEVIEAIAPTSPYALWESSRIPKSGNDLARDEHRYAFIALDCSDTSVYQGEELTQLRNNQEVSHRRSTDPLESARVMLESTRHYATPSQCAAEFGLELPSFIGGAIAALSYDAGTKFEQIAGATQHPRQPASILHYIHSLIVLDRTQELLLHIQWPSDKESFFELQSLRTAASQFAQTTRSESRVDTSSFSPSLLDDVEILRSKDEFVQMVSRAQDYIAAGDIVQVVLANRLKLSQRIDTLELYHALRTNNPSPYHFLFPWQGGHIVGASPESMLRCLKTDKGAQQVVSMRLVAGTYPRNSKNEELEAIAARFWEDEKERAEHVMLVDHVRNDIGRSAEIGSVKVKELLSVEPYRDVYHLVSEVEGILLDEYCSLDALCAAFPIATLTGTPKIRAMEIIAELEEAHRGFFGGALLVLGFDGFLDAAVAIRTAVLEREASFISVGAGIVYDSVAEREYEECLWKARSLLQAISSLEQRLAA